MILWLLAVCVIGVVTLVGYYQGGLRAAFSFVGLFVAAGLAVPLSGIARAILPVFGLKHPVAMDFVAPFIIFVLLMTIFKLVAFTVHHKAETHYKYRASDTEKGMWDRLNQRLGVCLGLANGVIYFFLIAIVLYIIGYGSVQLASTDKEHWSLKALNAMARDVQSTGLHKAVAPFAPATTYYYDAVDALGYIFHTPLLQSRVSSYPAFLRVAEQSKFESIASDSTFQQFWLQGPSLGEFVGHAKINPLVKDPELFKEVTGLLEGDLDDFKNYLVTGESEKFSDEKILGRWDINLKASFDEALRVKSNMPLAEKKWLHSVLISAWANATLTAYIDNAISLKRDNGSSPFNRGKWKHAYGPKYTLTVSDGPAKGDYDAIIQGGRMVVSLGKIPLVFEK